MTKTILNRIASLACLAAFLLVFTSSPSTPPTASASPAQEAVRPVLAEQFTGTWCPFCPGSSGALERLEDQLGSENLIVLAYHHAAGRSDPYHNQDSVDRANFYRITGFPTVYFNGAYNFVGGSTSPNEPNIDNGYMIRYQLSSRRPTPVQVELTGMLIMESPTRYTAHSEAVITVKEQITNQLVVRAVLIENSLQFRAPNGETHFDWVVRDVFDASPLTVTGPGQQETFARDVVIQPGWNPQHLAIVVFVQADMAARPEVLGVAKVDL